MAIHTWTASTNKNFSDPTAWSGGVVPSSGDSVLFDGSGAGQCTLDLAVELLDIQILAAYVGQFLQNGKKITLGSNGGGQLRIEGPATFNGEIDFYGNDILVNSSTGSTGTLLVFTDAEYRQGNVSSWKIHLQSGVVLLLPNTPHPQTNLTPYGVLYSNGIENNGTIESAVSFNSNYFRQNGLLVNLTSTERLIYTREMNVGGSHGVQGQWSIMSLSTKNTILSPGNYLGFEKISSQADVPITFAGGEFDLPLFQPNGNVAASSQTLLRCHADVVFGSAPTSFSATVAAAGTADQKLDIPASYNLVSYNGTGKIQFLSGNIQLTEESVFGSLDIPSNSSAVFRQNGQKITVGSNGTGKLWILKPATFDAAVDFHGDDVAVNASIGNQGILNIHTDTTYRQGNVSIWRVIVGENAIFTQPYNVHPNLGFSSYSVMYANGLLNYGTVNSDVSYNIGTFHNENIFQAASTTEHYIAASNISVGPSHSISGNIAIRGLASRKPTLAPGDYRGLTKIYSNIIDNSTFTFSNGEFDLPLFQPGGNVTASSNVTLRCHTDVIFAQAPTASFQAMVLCAANSTQTIDIQRNDQLIAMGIENDQGTPRLIGRYKLVRNSRSYAFPVLEPGSSLQLNGFQLQITGHELFLTESELERLDLDGELVFYGSDLVMSSFERHDASKITIAGTCDARFLSTTGEYDLPDIKVTETGCLRLPFSLHRYVSGTVADSFSVHGDVDICGTLEIPEPGQCRWNMSETADRFSAGRLVAGNNAELRIDPGTAELAPENLRVEGNVVFQWNADEATAKLAPGDYRAVSLLKFGENIATVSFRPGEYRFSSVNITTGNGKTIALLDSSGDGGVHCLGNFVICGEGICQTAMTDAHFESVSLDRPFVFDSDAIRIDRPEVLSDGRIEGNRLIALATSAFTMADDDSLDVETLHLLDGDGSFHVPEKGYRSLILEARESDSFVELDGVYQLENLHLAANAHRLTVDVCRSPKIAISGNITSERFHGGTIHVKGNGADQWIFNGSADQTIQLELEHGAHVLHRMIDAKPSGNIILELPLTVFDFRDQHGNHLSALDGMTILSDITLSTRLMSTREGGGEFQGQDGVELEQVSMITGEIVKFYAKIAAGEGEAIAVDWVESVTLDCRMMNPIAPSLHQPRKEIVRSGVLSVSDVLSQQFESHPSLPEGETYNFHFSNRNIPALSFEIPGLYHVVIGVKLFGHTQPLPMRYVLLCDRQ